ncbi:SGNH/GDSL hydrolase family protein [Rhizobium sp. S152]|uniref:SGNH/GDSL hydrolase family protein n=1 Tax=Rhizobium sp. S152 TaxID=3055038 RepID=UPI0025A9B759|nr:SGNH/GDSL hydrolase family protein [Rhizobium sp. S152]MDM9626074.1 SGNH/GDSL hydrolase family protein [Rhizobium sp. S152]
MLLGFSLAITQPARHRPSLPRPIAAFGDSLTAGTGASGPAHVYPALAATLFPMPRMIANRGIGGQTSTQIAVRQGGLPLKLAILGEAPRNLFPRTRDWQTTFETDTVNGLTHELVGTGIADDGLPYGDVRIHGVATASFTDIARQPYGALAANYEVTSGTSWTITGDIQKIAGSLTGVIGFNLPLIQSNELGAYLDEIASPSLPLDGARHRVSATGIASHPFIRSTFVLNVATGAAIDITLRIFPGQLEAGETTTALQLTPPDSFIPAYHPEQSQTFEFADDSDGWSARVQDGHMTPVHLHDGMLIVENDDGGVLRGCEYAMTAIPNGKIIHLAFDLQFLSGTGQVHVGGLQAPGGSWATTATDGNPTWVLDHGGHHELVLKSGNDEFANLTCSAITFVTSGSPLTFSLDNIVIQWGDDSPQVPVTYRSVDILTVSGAHSGNAEGSLSGIAGMIATDAVGQWTFTRHATGDAVPVPYASEFALDDALSLRRAIHWIWAGRNNAEDKATVLADIAAMAAYAAGGRYLIGSVLPAATDTPAALQSITALNTELAASHAGRYVDLLSVLHAAGDGTTEDSADIATGLVPRSLRADAVHLNDRGYAIVAAAWAEATLARGW